MIFNKSFSPPQTPPAVLERYVNLLDFTHSKNAESERAFYTYITEHYLSVLRSLKHHLPQHKKELWVLSAQEVAAISLGVLKSAEELAKQAHSSVKPLLIRDEFVGAMGAGKIVPVNKL